MLKPTLPGFNNKIEARLGFCLRTCLCLRLCCWAGLRFRLRLGTDRLRERQCQTYRKRSRIFPGYAPLDFLFHCTAQTFERSKFGRITLRWTVRGSGRALGFIPDMSLKSHGGKVQAWESDITVVYGNSRKGRDSMNLSNILEPIYRHVCAIWACIGLKTH